MTDREQRERRTAEAWDKHDARQLAHEKGDYPFTEPPINQEHTMNPTNAGPTDIRTLCARATPAIPQVPRSRAEAVLADAAGHARQEIASRLSPDVVLAVVEALEESDTAFQGGSSSVTKALALLNGTLGLTGDRTT